jgi:CAAX prenyl protease-like protein
MSGTVSDPQPPPEESLSIWAGINTHPASPYILPILVYLAITSLEPGSSSSLLGRPAEAFFPLLYGVKLLLVGWLTVRSLFTFQLWREFLPRPRLRDLTLAVVIGVVVFGLWVGLDGHYPTFSFLGRRSAFDPNTLKPVNKGMFIALRLLGLVILVPIFEEIFWRSFLIRWIINPEFKQVPIGKVTLVSAVVTSVLFALAHPEWLPALLTGLLWAGLLGFTKSLGACVISHSVANLALGIYVLTTGEWKYW